jgi:hypothetical protein
VVVPPNPVDAGIQVPVLPAVPIVPIVQGGQVVGAPIVGAPIVPALPLVQGNVDGGVVPMEFLPDVNHGLAAAAVNGPVVELNS